MYVLASKSARWDDTPNDYEHALGVIDKLRAKHELLCAALQEIVNDPGGYPADAVVDDMREIARKALADSKE
jgi:hypothetical protein